MTTDADLCAYSDLAPEACAHCRGNTQDAGFTTPAAPLPAAGRVIWSPTIERQRQTIGPRITTKILPTTNSTPTGHCRCGQPTHNNQTICTNCTAQLEQALAEVPWLTDELETSMTRQRAVGTEAGSPTATTPLPWHDKAAEAARHLHDILVLWVRLCHEERVNHDNLPADNSADLSRWLLRALPALARHDAAIEARNEITNAVEAGQRIVFWKRKNRTYLGRCGQVVLDESNEVIDTSCEGDVYADPDAAVGHCEWCGQGVTVVIRKDEITKAVDDRLCTAAEIARYAVFLGLDVPRDKVRKRVHYWHRHRRIEQRGTADDGAPMFRYAEVRTMLYAEYGRAAM